MGIFQPFFSDSVSDCLPSQGGRQGAPFSAEGRQIGEGFNVTPRPRAQIADHTGCTETRVSRLEIALKI